MNKILGAVIGAWMIMAAGLNAAPKIGGGFSYQFTTGNASVTLSLGAITNSSAENATGTILVQLWAMDQQYDGGRMRGHSIASYKLEGLEGGRQYSNLKKTLKAVMPARRGDYHMCITVSEYREGGYVITDNRNMSKVVTLAPAAPAKVNLTGAWSWKRDSEAGTLTMKVGKITNNKAGKSGSLRLAVWATKQPYNGGRINGFQLGSVDKKALEKGYSYSDVVNTAKFKKPPAGTYHTALFLLEYNGEEYVIVSHLKSTSTSTFN
ncbi:MAG: hypothetical protein ACO1TE_00210 [Prosthecobacter sp.]